MSDEGNAILFEGGAWGCRGFSSFAWTTTAASR